VVAYNACSEQRVTATDGRIRKYDFTNKFRFHYAEFKPSYLYYTYVIFTG